jgi:type IV pilus assembly protein PilN
MPRINLLPWREKQRSERKLHFFLALGGAVLLSGLVAGAAYVMLGVMIDSQDQRNERLKSQIKLLDQQIEQINDLEAQKQKFISRMQIIEKLQRSRPEVVHLFDELVKVMPDGTYLTSIKETGNKLKLEGVAQSSTRVSTLDAQHRGIHSG